MIAIITLAFIIIALLVERYFYTKEMNGKLMQAMEAVMSKNMNDYLAVKTLDKKSDVPFTESDEVDLGQATDKEFMQHIEKQTQ